MLAGMASHSSNSPTGSSIHLSLDELAVFLPLFLFLSVFFTSQYRDPQGLGPEP